MAEWAPIREKRRNPAIDILRGFSLFGILMVNMLSFLSPYLYINPYDWFKAEDRAIVTWIEVFFQSSFYPIFAFLFGYGLMVQKQRAERAGVEVYQFLFRRLSVLLVLGLAHAWLIWPGDILAAYAVFGMMLLPFLKLGGKVLMFGGAALFFIPHLLISFYLMVMAIRSPDASLLYTDWRNATASLQVYANGSFIDITKRRWLDWYAVYGPSGTWHAFLSVFPLIMAGAGVCREGWLTKRRIPAKKWLLFFCCCFAFGLFCKLLPVIVAPILPFLYIRETIGGVILSGAYVALIELCVKHRLADFLRPVAMAGRMSLSNYISQSGLASLIFYAYGLGLYGKLSVSSGVLLVVLLFLMQVLVSDIWLHRFRYGPLEWGWRRLSYRNDKKG
ncbi:DUF418 domain-containing protein [Weizmannia coagulans]|nr:MULTISPECIES: DUF418 domain-containing protein [Heyndrickxia]APB38436.1 hypothetical protein BIZ35_01395 [Heyndrickxia coagulans]ATW84810.1 DUF418 domain-containing protein [Heyndrickxia coagulans]AVD55527.1 DUF418 domain-containing protein [Heyndrickxia coagulans]AWP36402.1 DUF418 domain-containing protein [Heyndrickxia coagulans]KGB30844.1 hypothetical protein IE89_02255 [Heyndrickxia coagulans]